MAKDAFDSFRKKLQKKPQNVDEEPEAPPPADEPDAESAAPESPPEDPSASSALERMRAARAKLQSLKGQSAQRSGSSLDRPAAGSLSERAKSLKQKRLDVKPAARALPQRGKQPPAQRARKSAAPAGGDDFESFRRAKQSDEMADAKRRAFEEGVEVQELDPSRMARERAQRLDAEELGVERGSFVITARFTKADLEKMQEAELTEVSGERPAAFDRQRAKRLGLRELAADPEATVKPAGFESHRARRLSASEARAGLRRPEGFTSHRHPKVEDEEERDPEEIEGFRRFDF